jgi:hypothetical protein
MKRTTTVAILTAGVLSLSAACQAQAQDQKDNAMREMIDRGKMLVTLGGCNDCHTPKIFTPKGPVVDESRALSGAPSDAKILPVPDGVLGPDKWGAITTNDLTTWAGPWGVSFARNLTPDVATGLGSWTEAMFIKALRTGKDMGEGRSILPPMPWEQIGQLPDSELKAIFAYLKSIKPVKNAIHDPIPPPGAPAPGK